MLLIALILPHVLGVSPLNTTTVAPPGGSVTTEGNSVDQSRADNDTAMTSSVTGSSVLEGNELMEYLFDIEFHRDVMDDACYAKLKEYGYWERLGFFQRFCLCRLLCIPPHVNHKLDDVDQKRVTVARQQESKEKSKEARFGEQLDLTVGVTAACGVLIVVGVVGNTIVLIAVSKFMKKPSSTYIYLCSVACSDLLVNVVCLPILLYKRVYTGSTSIHVCRTMNLFFYTSLGCSIFSLLVMSIDRYLAICCPLKAQMMATMKRAMIITIIVWLMAVAAASPYVYFTTSLSNCAIVVPAGLGFRLFVIIAGLVLYLIPVVIMLFGYVFTGITLCRRRTEKRQTGEEKKVGQLESSVTRISVMLLVVLVAFIICWTPYWWYYVSLAFGVINNMMTSAMPLYEKIIVEYSVLIVAMANSSINPILYACTSKAFRNACKRCFCCCCREPHSYMVSQDSHSGTESSRTTASDFKSTI